MACYAYTKKCGNRLFSYRKHFDEEKGIDRLDRLHGLSDASGNIDFFLVAASKQFAKSSLRGSIEVTREVWRSGKY